jgi:myo-inositol-1(or 4)-monophosphatase
MQSILDTAAAVAREAGALINEFAAKRIGFELKGEHDLVTAADRASEKLIVQRLTAAFPSHSIVAEEGGGQQVSSEYCWYVDPLDGTTNFAHGFPVYNVSIGLEKAGQLVAGVVYDPTRDEMFSAERGSGAFLNGERIHVSNVERLNDALVATGFPSRRRHQNVNVHFYYQLAMLTHGVRRAGAAALDICYVACGRLDGFWEFGLNPWDMAAGVVILEEAGGRYTDMLGKPIGVRAPHILSSNRILHPEMEELFAAIFREEYRYPMVQMTLPSL